MNYIKTNHLFLLLVAFLVLSSLFGGSTADTGFQVGAISRDTTTVNNPWTFSQGLTNSTTLAQTGAATFSSTGSFAGLLTLNAGQLRSYTNSTSTTATSQTLAVADVLNYDTVIITPNTGALTLTFFASSTATTLVPTAGDLQETCFYNATTTAAAPITFAAGTGIDLEVASSTATAIGSLNLASGATGCFKFFRQPSTASTFDITATYTAFVDAD